MAGESWALWVQLLCTWSVSIHCQLEMSGRDCLEVPSKKQLCEDPQKQLCWDPKAILETISVVFPSSHQRTLPSYGSNVTVT